ncbi:MAG: DUF222 domain-containing protein [Microbacterium sp.]|uniref:HNH endonuclease n=1 Tax=Microbacterium sp. TaxID=51671 RepID=UPI0039E71982
MVDRPRTVSDIPWAYPQVVHLFPLMSVVTRRIVRMNDLLATAATALDAVRALCPAGTVAGLGSGELVALNEAFGLLRRAVDAAYLPVAAEISRQSRTELGKDSLARKNGFRSPTAMISTVTGTSPAEAARAISVGEATAPRLALSGEERPARHPGVAAAVQAATIGTLAAGAIISLLDRVALRADAVAMAAMERRLVDAAPGLSIDQLQKLLLRAEAHLDPDGTEPRDQERRGQRTLSIHQDRAGMFVINGRLDPVTGAPVAAAIEGIVTGVLRRREAAVRSRATRERSAAAGGSAAVPELAAEDGRTVGQIRADALADLCRHAIGCTSVPTGPQTTVVVRMSLDDLESGTGTATIDGVIASIGAGTARRLAVDAHIIPCVLGGDSEVLDWGRAKRLFTGAQKLALVERDGGCSFCGAPPGMTVVHHIDWWKRDQGTTDLRNGVLLCTACHHRIHDDGWEIRLDGPGVRANVWFVPPPWLDPDRSPRLGGRARYDLVA